ncbi:MAG: transporter [Gemmatimonadaceae bacterium]
MSTRRICLWLVPLAACGCATFHSPPGPVLTDRPGYTDTPTVLPGGAVQIEGGYTSDRTGSTTYQSVGELLLRAGIGSRLELRLFGNSYATLTSSGARIASGLEDSKIGAKFALIDKPDSVHTLTPSLALLAATTLPTGARLLGAGRAQPEAKLAASWTTSTPLSVFANAAIGAVYDGTGWGDHGWESVATWYELSSRVSLFVEEMHLYNISGNAPAGTDIDGGLTIGFGDRFQVDARIGRGVGGLSGSERFVGVGFGRRF